MAIFANDANDLIDQLILLTKRLADIAKHQAKMFAENAIEEFAKLNDEAARLTSTYTIESARIAREPHILNHVDLNLKEQLKAETKIFRDILAQHEQAIERGKTLAEGLVKAIASEAIAQRPAPQAYSPSLRGIEGPKQNTTAIALDRRA